MPWLINAGQLDKFRKNQKNLVILDASWHLPSENRHAKEEFLLAHIPGARFLDLENFRDKTSSLPNMLLRNEEEISEKIASLGITPEHKIIFYDRSDLHSSCRALWMFKVYGHLANHLYILDGGFSAWEQYGGKIESGIVSTGSGKTYPIYFHTEYIRTLMQIKTNLHHPSEQLVDMRHPVRFAGGSEHKPHLRSGHIPGSFSFPYFTMFDKEGKWKPIETIKKQLSGIGIALNVPIVTTCGSAITATILNFALDLMNHPAHSVYDGSWSEWGYDELYPGESSLQERPVERSIDK